jgi:hypothetical protein
MDLVTVNETAIAAFGAAASALGGDSKPFIRFDKGDWYTGQDNQELPHGTKLAVDMMHAEWGWIRWKDQKPVDRRMVTIASGQPPAARDTLGGLDEALWDVDASGKRRDPWQRTIELPVREVSGDKRELLIAGSSKGFEGACKRLFKTFGEQMRLNGGKVPIVELRSDKYQHAQYGMVKVPDLPLVEWKTAAELESKAEKPKAVTKF